MSALAGFEVVEDAGPRVAGDGGDLKSRVVEEAFVVGEVFGQVVQAVGGGGDRELVHVVRPL
jgi:hypothetical protein